MKQILLADDHELMLEGVRAVLEIEPEWRVCGLARDGREAVELAGRLLPDVAILDLVMPVLSGFEAARHIRHASPRTEVLILTGSDSEELSAEACAAGAYGYVLKTDGAARTFERRARSRTAEAHVARARDRAAPRRGEDELVCREHPRHQREDGRDAPGAHHGEARLSVDRRARALRGTQPDGLSVAASPAREDLPRKYLPAAGSSCAACREGGGRGSPCARSPAHRRARHHGELRRHGAARRALRTHGDWADVGPDPTGDPRSLTTRFGRVQGSHVLRSLGAGSSWMGVTASVRLALCVVLGSKLCAPAARVGRRRRCGRAGPPAGLPKAGGHAGPRGHASASRTVRPG